MKLGEEKAAVLAEKGAIEQERVGLREELGRMERDKGDLETEPAGTYILHIYSARIYCTYSV